MSKKKSSAEEIGSKLKPAQARFVYLLLGGEDGKCFNNATLAYIRAYDIDANSEKVNGKYTNDYMNAKSQASRLVTNVNIQKFKSAVLLEAGYKPETIKKRFAELAYQNKNLVVAHNATRDIGKIAGVIKEDRTPIDVPQLEELGNAIKAILTPKK